MEEDELEDLMEAAVDLKPKVRPVMQWGQHVG